MRELICIVCPRGCHLHVEEGDSLRVTGNGCPRGARYAEQEMRHPTRTITSTVAVSGGFLPRCPVKTSAPIPKELIFAAMKTLDGLLLHAPVEPGQVVVRNICGTGVDFITTRGV